MTQQPICNVYSAPTKQSMDCHAHHMYCSPTNTTNDCEHVNLQRQIKFLKTRENTLATDDLPKLLQYDWVYDHYVVQRIPASEIASMLNVTKRTVLAYVKHHNIAIIRPLTLEQRKWLKQHNLTYPVKCKMCNNVVEWGSGQYRTYCSRTCTTRDKDHLTSKAMATNQIKYGGQPMQNNQIKQRVKQKWHDKYGGHPSTVNATKQTAKQTCVDQYGVEYISQKHMRDVLPLLDNKEWLNEQYNVQLKPAASIARELNIGATAVLRRIHSYGWDINPTVGFSWKAIEWLDAIAAVDGITILHALNGGEYKIPGTKFKVDGFCVETNTVYEFHGDAFHGNPNIYQSHELCNPWSSLTASELYNKTKEREQTIRDKGFNVVTIWESDYDKINS